MERDRTQVESLGRIMVALSRAGILARHELADIVGLTRATVSKAVQELLDHGLIEEVERGKASSRGGPRPILLKIKPDAFHVVGLDVRREKITGCLVNLNGEIKGTAATSLDHEASAATEAELMDALRSVVEKLAKLQDAPILAMGVGSVGPIDAVAGVSHPANFPALNGFPLVNFLRDTLGIPVTIRTGAVAAAYGEDWASADEEPIKSIAFVVIDYRGIGVGLISNGEGWLTDHDGVGELGHLSIDLNGRPCECGRRGCLTQYASGGAAIRSRGLAMTKALPEEAMMARIALDADDGDEAAQAALLEAGRYLGYGVVDVDRMLRPTRIVIGSSHERLADWYLRGVSEYVEEVRETTEYAALGNRIKLARSGSAAIAYGAASMQIKQIIRSPGMVLGSLKSGADNARRAG